MGRIAAELADDVIVTDDNPRTEDPARIVADILAGMPALRGHDGRARPRARHSNGIASLRSRRRRARRRQRTRGLPDLRHVTPAFQRSGDRAAPHLQGRPARMNAQSASRDFAQCLRRHAPWRRSRSTRPSRAIRARSARGDLFVALRGPRFDGNEFVARRFGRRRRRRGRRHAAIRGDRADRRCRHAGRAWRRRVTPGARSSRFRWWALPAATARPRRRR